jgi:metallo-beta-lactamase family protein
MDSFSAHADRSEMVDFLSNQKESLKKIYLVHGEYKPQLKFKKYLKEHGFGKVIIPELGQEFKVK